jgi:hypothetical protein
MIDLRGSAWREGHDLVPLYIYRVDYIRLFYHLSDIFEVWDVIDRQVRACIFPDFDDDSISTP